MTIVREYMPKYISKEIDFRRLTLSDSVSIYLLRIKMRSKMIITLHNQVIFNFIVSFNFIVDQLEIYDKYNKIYDKNEFFSTIN